MLKELVQGLANKEKRQGVMNDPYLHRMPKGWMRMSLEEMKEHADEYPLWLRVIPATLLALFVFGLSSAQGMDLWQLFVMCLETWTDWNWVPGINSDVVIDIATD